MSAARRSPRLLAGPLGGALAGVLLAAGLAALAPACGSVHRSEPFAGAMDLSDPALARGAAVYARRCEACHPGGEGGLGPSLNDKPLPAWLMRIQVRHGLGVMPEFPEEAISDGLLDDLLAYVKARRALEPLPDAPEPLPDR
jgi:mono/diheme cytochrome c family protein